MKQVWKCDHCGKTMVNRYRMQEHEQTCPKRKKNLTLREVYELERKKEKEKQ